MDFLFVDLPTALSDIHLDFATHLSPDGIILITTPDPLSHIASRRSINTYKQLQVPVLGIIENKSYYLGTDKQKEKQYLFGKEDTAELCRELEVNFLGKVPFVEEEETLSITDLLHSIISQTTTP